jgi:hypothetical protein
MCEDASGHIAAGRADRINWAHAITQLQAQRDAALAEVDRVNQMRAEESRAGDWLAEKLKAACDERDIWRSQAVRTSAELSEARHLIQELVDDATATADAYTGRGA